MAPEKQEKNPLYSELASELQAMVDVDQEMRERSEKEDNFWDHNIDRKNTERMKEIITRYGFPTISMVGAEGMENAWLLIQHADHDVDFQENCLELMKKVAPDEIDRTRIAYLEDRVRVNRKMGQLYGTQFYQKDGKHIPQTIEDENHVNERRAQMGMGTLQDQIDSMYEKYGVPRDITT
ncbi:MAG: DUF6624 domain-containing protein [Candidatus Paceibacterota bacterium]